MQSVPPRMTSSSRREYDNAFRRTVVAHVRVSRSVAVEVDFLLVHPVILHEEVLRRRGASENSTSQDSEPPLVKSSDPVFGIKFSNSRQIDGEHGSAGSTLAVVLAVAPSSTSESSRASAFGVDPTPVDG